MSPLKLLQDSLMEDAPSGDLTCNVLINNLQITEDKTLGHFIAKQDLVLSGMDFFKAIEHLNLGIEVEVFFNNGSFIKKGQKICQLYGPWNQLVLVERSILNIVGHLSGIATLTYLFVQKTKHTSCKILDTRKTLPLLREFEKRAVVHGGGHNHRMNLSDEIMLKENHISRLMLSLKDSLILLKEKFPKHKITVECQNMDQVIEASQTPVDQILLDNMDNESLAAAVKLIPSNIKSEASGNMSLDRVQSVAETGVDFISVGALTHSAPVADISFLIDN